MVATLILIWFLGTFISISITVVRGPYRGWSGNLLPMLFILLLWPVGLPWYLSKKASYPGSGE